MRLAIICSACCNDINCCSSNYFLRYSCKQTSRKKFFKEVNTGKETFFFGSFDRLDPNFNHVTWEKYFNDIAQFFGGDKKLVFNELIKESFQVRKALSKKFNYLSIAYKAFFAGFLISIPALCFVIIFRGE